MIHFLSLMRKKNGMTEFQHVNKQTIYALHKTERSSHINQLSTLLYRMYLVSQQLIEHVYAIFSRCRFLSAHYAFRERYRAPLTTPIVPFAACSVMQKRGFIVCATALALLVRPAACASPPAQLMLAYYSGVSPSVRVPHFLALSVESRTRGVAARTRNNRTLSAAN